MQPLRLPGAKQGSCRWVLGGEAWLNWAKLQIITAGQGPALLAKWRQNASLESALSLVHRDKGTWRKSGKAAEPPRREQFRTAKAAGLMLIPLWSSRGPSGRVDADPEAAVAFGLVRYLSLLCFSVRAAAVAVISAALLGSPAPARPSFHDHGSPRCGSSSPNKGIRLQKAEDSVIRDCLPLTSLNTDLVLRDFYQTPMALQRVFRPVVLWRVDGSHPGSHT